MMRPWMALIMMMSTVILVGCTGQKHYDGALSDTDVMKVELERALAQKNTLEEQLKALKDLNVKFQNEAQIAQDEVERLLYGRTKEHTQVKELEDRVETLLFQSQAARQESEESARHNAVLKSLLARYQKELKSKSPLLADVPSSPDRSISRSGPVAEVPPMMKTFPQMPGTLNINKASATQMMLELGLTREVADRIVLKRPYRVKGELLAKEVLQRDIFDMIKERITLIP